MKIPEGSFDEFVHIALHQPVFAGNLISHQSCKKLQDIGLVMYYGDDEISGYVLTELGKQIYSGFKAAHDIMCNGILYKPKGCELTKDFREKGCGNCGKGHLSKCGRAK